LWGFSVAAFFFIVLFCWIEPVAGASAGAPEHFSSLQARLISDGFKQPVIESLYSRSQISFDRKVISVYFSHREAKLNYDQFLSSSSIDKTVKYFSNHEKALKRAEKEYGVKAEVICAIILVETRLGTVMGSRLVINTLSTLADLHDGETRDRVWRKQLKGKTDRTREQFDAWAARKSAWAYNELKAYIEYTSSQGIDPATVYGSFAGAMGIAQFIPTSVQSFAQDGNKDGQINLYQHEDAIESIASYLKGHGWRPSLSRKEAFDVILTYNNSRYYADTILKVAERVKKRRKG
jgi:membrane-bound lytic murein transglycosylase B